MTSEDHSRGFRRRQFVAVDQDAGWDSLEHCVRDQLDVLHLYPIRDVRRDRVELSGHYAVQLRSSRGGAPCDHVSLERLDLEVLRVSLENEIELVEGRVVGDFVEHREAVQNLAFDERSDLGEELMSVPGDPDGLYGENKRINMGFYGGTWQASLARPGYSSEPFVGGGR